MMRAFDPKLGYFMDHYFYEPFYCEHEMSGLCLKLINPFATREEIERSVDQDQSASLDLVQSQIGFKSLNKLAITLKHFIGFFTVCVSTCFQYKYHCIYLK